MRHVVSGLNEYQSFRDNFTTYKGQGGNQGLNYALMGLGGEVGELQNKFKKLLRTAEDLDDVVIDVPLLADELGDCLWYVAAVAKELGLTLQEVAAMNLEKLTARSAERQANESGTGTSGSSKDNGGTGHCIR